MQSSSKIKVWVKRILILVNKTNSETCLEEKLFLTNVVLQMEI